MNQPKKFKWIRNTVFSICWMKHLYRDHFFKNMHLAHYYCVDLKGLKRFMENSRTYKTVKNSIINIFNQAVSIILQFAIRTLFIRYLQIEYLGVGGLFSNVLSMLSLTELGLGAAIICGMYKPIAEHDEERIRRFFYTYKKVYYVIGTIIGCLGLCLVPFLHILIRDADHIPNLQLLFVLFLLDTVVSYFFAQYRSIYSADQKDYVNAYNKLFITLLQTVFQAISLILFRNYIVFLVIRIACNLLAGYIISIKAKRDYPYLRLKASGGLDSFERKQLINDTIGVFSIRVSLAVLNSSDNLIMSAFLGSVAVAYYSNYSLLIATISTVIGLLITAVSSSIGNYCVVHTKQEEQFNMFMNLNYSYYVIYGFSFLCLWGLASPFISLWLGEDFLLGNMIVLSMIFKYYFTNSRQINLNFITVNHLSQHLKYKNLIEAVINIVISILLVRRIGMSGIFWGTCIGEVLTSVWFEPYVVFKYHFKKDYNRYVLRYLENLVFFSLGVFILYYLRTSLFTGTVPSFLLLMLCTAFIAAALVVLPYLGSSELRFGVTALKSLIMQVASRRGK